ARIAGLWSRASGSGSALRASSESLACTARQRSTGGKDTASWNHPSCSSRRQKPEARSSSSEAAGLRRASTASAWAGTIAISGAAPVGGRVSGITADRKIARGARASGGEDPDQEDQDNGERPGGLEARRARPVARS